MELCTCGNEFLYSQDVITQIGLKPSCDALFDPDYCETGTFVLSVDVWLAIQKGDCVCEPFANDARTLRLYWNEHPIQTDDTVTPTASKRDEYSFLLSIASLTAVLLGFFIFAVVRCRYVARRRRPPRRRRRMVVTENYQSREPTANASGHIELSGSTERIQC